MSYFTSLICIFFILCFWHIFLHLATEFNIDNFGLKRKPHIYDNIDEMALVVAECSIAGYPVICLEIIFAHVF